MNKFKKASILLLSSFAFCAGALAAESTPKGWKQFSSDKVNLKYPEKLGTKVSVKEVKEVALENPDDKPDGVAPRHWMVEFEPSQAKLYLFPAKLDGMSEADFKKKFPTTATERDALAKLLKEKQLKPKETIPVLPWADESTPFEVQRKHLTFKGGAGFRSLAEYLIEPDEISNEKLVYSAQGLTSDNKYYVSLIVPVKAKTLPEKSTLAKADAKKYEEFSKTFPAHARAVGAKLDKLPVSAFSPDLTSLDQLFQSITIK